MYNIIAYTVEGDLGSIVENERDVSVILRAISSAQQPIRRYIARFYEHESQILGKYGLSKLEYLPADHDFKQFGLYYYGLSDTKLSLYKFEELIYDNYEMAAPETEMEYGLPCEVLAAVIDMRGFSAFCEQPQIESPYTCGVMTAFYSMIKNSFLKYPPELVKFLGDGVLAIWQTDSNDRDIAVEVAMDGLRRMRSRWIQVAHGPHFSHGAPEGLGAGLSFGLASKISVDKDYIGRPINLASRLCGICPPAKIYVDKSVPNVGGFETKQSIVRLKSFGDYKVWVLEGI